MGADIDDSFFYAPDPECKCAVKERVDGYGDSGIELCGLEAEFVVPVESRCGDEECGVAEGQAGVNESVRLDKG